MKIFFTRLLPVKRIAAVNLFGAVLAPKKGKITQTILNHETIHTRQMKEMAYIFFYLWYLVEWLIRLFGRDSAYRRISFEREAYLHEQDGSYLQRRKPYEWVKYV
ncbi:MAG: hypothetical protein GXY72_14005 [Deltaproteobacteria bacterium]|nr:hypothetical protein [Deltaproteobacteria bacterium]